MENFHNTNQVGKSSQVLLVPKLMSNKFFFKYTASEQAVKVDVKYM